MKHAALSFFSHETWELGDAFPARDRRAVIKGHSVGWVVFKGLYYLYIYSYISLEIHIKQPV